MGISRRAFLRGSAAAVGAASLVGPGALAVHAWSEAGLDGSGAGASPTPMLLTVTDARRGRFEILVGETSVSFTDRALAGRLHHATKAVNAHVVTS